MSDGISDARRGNEKLLNVEAAAMRLVAALKECYDPMFGINGAAIREVNDVFKDYKIKLKLVEVK